ncbi:MAG TPA: hypothetical protein VMW46_03375 [Candidatus Desulfaltia sp.]|nr:hypothetical protein [Candidatus Desulfaltia sp.]
MKGKQLTIVGAAVYLICWLILTEVSFAREALGNIAIVAAAAALILKLFVKGGSANLVTFICGLYVGVYTVYNFIKSIDVLGPLFNASMVKGLMFIGLVVGAVVLAYGAFLGFRRK